MIKKSIRKTYPDSGSSRNINSRKERAIAIARILQIPPIEPEVLPDHRYTKAVTRFQRVCIYLGLFFVPGFIMVYLIVNVYFDVEAYRYSTVRTEYMSRMSEIKVLFWISWTFIFGIFCIVEKCMRKYLLNRGRLTPRKELWLLFGFNFLLFSFYISYASIFSDVYLLISLVLFITGVVIVHLQTRTVSKKQ